MSTDYENTDLTCALAAHDKPAVTFAALEALVNGTIDFKFFTMMAIDPGTPADNGSFRPLKVLTREGSVFHAQEPAAIGFYFETEVRVYDLVWRCLAPHIAERLPAGHFSSICGTFLGGIHPDTGRQYTIIEPQLGCWGAWEGRDGNPCIFSDFHGETFNTPAEISEARNGLYVDRMELNTEPGGEGQFNGGRGLVQEYRIRTERGFLTAGFTRSKVKPWALEGAEESSGNSFEVIKPEGTEGHSFVKSLSLTTDDVVGIVSSSGAGYGDPTKRDPEAVLLDIKNGLLSEEEAKLVHGIGG